MPDIAPFFTLLGVLTTIALFLLFVKYRIEQFKKNKLKAEKIFNHKLAVYAKEHPHIKEMIANFSQEQRRLAAEGGKMLYEFEGEKVWNSHKIIDDSLVYVYIEKDYNKLLKDIKAFIVTYESDKKTANEIQIMFNRYDKQKKRRKATEEQSRVYKEINNLQRKHLHLQYGELLERILPHTEVYSKEHIIAELMFYFEITNESSKSFFKELTNSLYGIIYEDPITKLYRCHKYIEEEQNHTTAN